MYKHFHILMYLFPNVQSCINIIYILKSDKHEQISLSTRIQTLHVTMFCSHHNRLWYYMLIRQNKHLKTSFEQFEYLLTPTNCLHMSLLITLLLSSHGDFLFNFIEYWDDLWCLAFPWNQCDMSLTLIKLLPWPFVLFLVVNCFKIQVELENTESCLHKVIWICSLIELYYIDMKSWLYDLMYLLFNKYEKEMKRDMIKEFPFLSV